MGYLRATFRDLNTERDPNTLQSGTAEASLNVVIDGTTLRGREGFDIFDSGPGQAILNMTTVTFANGETFLVCKCGDGKLYKKEFYPTTGSWAAIADKYSNHHTTDRGWFYVWGDRLYYFDRDGGTKWHPDDGVWKAGISQGAAPTIAADSNSGNGGGKEGYYHVYTTRVNSKTNEEGVLSLVSLGVTTNLSEGNGAIAISGGTWTTITTDANHEFDRIHIYCSMGDEYIGLGDGVEVFTYRAYLEAIVTYSGSWPSAPLLCKADFAQDRSMRYLNNGGQPPASRTGFFNGGRAVYLDVYSGAVAYPGAVMFSLPTIPTMVPQAAVYSYSNDIDDTTLIKPRPWEGLIYSGLGGAVTGCGAVGDRFIAFTKNQTWWLVPLRNGKLHPILADDARGAMSDKGVVTFGATVHALANNAWLRASREGVQNVARYKFTPTIEAIPAAYRGLTVAAKYTHRSEVWMAVVKAGGTKATRILIWDESRRGLMGMFDPANLGSAGIAAMCELSTPSHSPQMLIGLDDGTILSYPETGVYVDDNANGGATYACTWRGHFGQERRHMDQHLQNVEVHMGNNLGGLTFGAVGLRTAGEGTTAVCKTISCADDVDVSGAEFSPNRDGHLFQIEFSTDAGISADWAVEDMILTLHTQR